MGRKPLNDAVSWVSVSLHRSMRRIDKLGVTGSSPVPPIENGCKSHHVVAHMGDERHRVARIGLAMVFAQESMQFLRPSFNWLRDVPRLRRRVTTPNLHSSRSVGLLLEIGEVRMEI